MAPQSPLAAVRSTARAATFGAIRLALPLALLAATSDLLLAQPRQPRNRPTSRTIGKLDDELNRRAQGAGAGRRSRVIVRVEAGRDLPAALKGYQRGNRLELIDGFVLDVPDTALGDVARHLEVSSAHVDRPTWAADYLSTHATAAFVANETPGVTGKGIGVAVLDSGVTTWHDDLTSGSRSPASPYGNQRVARFEDFVNAQRLPYDDHGHGSHVAGIILGNGYDSDGRHAGMAPDASVVALKVLDEDGKGTVSRIIAALDWVAANARTYNIRVVNLSAGAGVTESYWTDPLTVATKRLVDRGIVVVAAAGNLGRNASGQKQYGGILSPANAPWVLTVGASSTQGTVKRADDELAGFSSLGPTRGDYLAKPDLVAPGYGVLSLAVPGSTLFSANQQFLVRGSKSTGYAPYLALSGTSMAAPQVAGAVALMLEANPRLTPNLVKAILQYTAQSYPEYGPLEQGGGFLDALSAVRLSAFYGANRAGSVMPIRPTWSRHVVWGNHLISGGYLNPRGSAWSTSTVWGAEAQSRDENIVWGTACGGGCDNIVWGTRDANGENIVWGTGGAENIVWGTGGADNIVWGTGAAENIVWGTSLGRDENIVWGTDCGGGNCHDVVWGTAREENIVWGTGGFENIVWGTAGPHDNIVWGTGIGENIVWGTSAEGNIVWGTAGLDNIVWGTAGDANIVWGTAAPEENIVWGTAGLDNIVWGTAGESNIVWGTGFSFDNLIWSAFGADATLWGPFGIFSTPAPRW